MFNWASGGIIKEPVNSNLSNFNVLSVDEH